VSAVDTSALSDAERKEKLQRPLATLYAVPLLGVVALFLYAWAADKFLSVLALSLLIAVAAWIFGVLLGFIFGIPRSVASPERASGTSTRGVRSNTNLEEISDWLTKILVGLGLVELGRIASGAHSLVDFLAPAFGTGDVNSGAAAATVALFSVSGFLAGYIFTRLNIGPLFAETERTLSDLGKSVEETKKLEEALGEPPSGHEVEADQAIAPVPESVADRGDANSAVTLARAKVIELVSGQYRLLYGEEPSDTSAALSRLRKDGYMDAALERLAKSLDRVTDQALRSEAPSSDQARDLIDSANAFIRNAGYQTSVAFESKVGEALKELPRAKVESRPRGYADGKLVPDFVVTANDVRIVVEAYLPQGQLRPALLNQRIDDRLKLVERTKAVGLLVVLPDGVTEIPDVDREHVVVVRLSDVKKDAGKGDLLDPKRYE
jgi:hypothetical protein